MSTLKNNEKDYEEEEEIEEEIEVEEEEEIEVDSEESIEESQINKNKNNKSTTPSPRKHNTTNNGNHEDNPTGKISDIIEGKDYDNSLSINELNQYIDNEDDRKSYKSETELERKINAEFNSNTSDNIEEILKKDISNNTAETKINDGIHEAEREAMENNDIIALNAKKHNGKQFQGLNKTKADKPNDSHKKDVNLNSMPDDDFQNSGGDIGYTEDKFSYYNNVKLELERQCLENENEYDRKIETFLGKLKRGEETYNEIIKKIIQTKTITKIQEDKTTKESSFFSSKINETKEEINTYKSLIKSEKEKNKEMITSLLYKSDVIQKIKLQLKDVDLTGLEKFETKLNQLSDDEARNTLKSDGGDYMKLLASIIYYLIQLKKRYLSNKLDNPQDDKVAVKKAEPEVIGNIQSHGKIYYADCSFVISFDTEYKKRGYTFENLRDDLCEMLSIPLNEYHNYHILEGVYIYCPSLGVYPTHGQYYSKHMYGDQEYIQMKSKADILNNKRIVDIATNDIALIDIKELNKKNVVSQEHAVFYSLGEEYIKEYRTIEGSYLFFKKDLPGEEIINANKAKIDEVNKNKMNAINRNIEMGNEEDNQNIEWRAGEQIKRIKDKFQRDKNVYLNRREPPIYISELNLYRYHLSKVLFFVIFTCFSLCLYYTSGNAGENEIGELQKEDTYLTNLGLFNPLYQNIFMVDDATFKLKDVNKLIKTKRDILLWGNIVGNNIMFQEGATDFTPLHNSKEPYEGFYSIRFVFKLNNEYYCDNPGNYNKFTEAVNTQFAFCENDLLPTKGNALNHPFSLPFSFPPAQLENICNTCSTTNRIEYNAEEEGYVGYLHNKDITRTDLNNLLSSIKNNGFGNNNLREGKVNFNINHIIVHTITKFDFIFSFLPGGGISVDLKKYVIDTTENKGFLFKLVTYFIEVVKYVFILLTLYKTFCVIVKSKRLRITIYPILYDYVVVIFILVSYFLSLQRNSGNKQFQSIAIESIDNTSDVNLGNMYEFKDYQKLKNESGSAVQIDAIVIGLILLRNIMMGRVSPGINTIFIVLKESLLNAINLIVILTLLTISFGIMGFTNLGYLHKDYSTLESSMFQAVFMVLGPMNIGGGGDILESYQYIFLIVFIILIKFIIYIFFYSIIYHSFMEVHDVYEKYTKSIIYQINQDFIYEFLKDLLMPVSWYFMLKKYFRGSKMFTDVDLEDIIDQDDDKEKQYGYSFKKQKFVIEERDIIYVYSVK